MTDDDIITAILQREGGYVDHPEDGGGPTNHGITQGTLTGWRGRPVSVDDVKNLSETEARSIYRQRYILDPGLFKVKDDKLRAFLVDSAVNHGPKNAIKMFQRCLKIKDDGVFGNATFAAMVSADPGTLYRAVMAERLRFYGRLITNDHTQAAFAAGWLSRVASFVEMEA